MRKLFLLATSLILFSCKDNIEIEPTIPEVSEIFELKLKSQEVVTFQSIKPGQEPIALGEEKIEEYFGTRVQSFLSVDIKIKNDSTTFIKPGSFQEKYRSKWENKDELYIYNSNNDMWTLLGKKSGDTFVLKSAFFFKKVSGKERNRSILGQAYALENFDTLVSSDEQYSLIWLKIDATYN